MAQKRAKLTDFLTPNKKHNSKCHNLEELQKSRDYQKGIGWRIKL
jgi:hypothetical protein